MAPSDMVIFKMLDIVLIFIYIFGHCDVLCCFIYKTRRKPVSRGLDACTMKIYYKMLNNLINIYGCTSKHSIFIHSLKKKEIFMIFLKTQNDVS
jgi:hypothetical protein